MSNMRKGQTVTIYEDPITELKPEGDARLVNQLDANAGYFEGRRLERWLVRFVDGPDQSEDYERAILAPVQTEDGGNA